MNRFILFINKRINRQFAFAILIIVTAILSLFGAVYMVTYHTVVSRELDRDVRHFSKLAAICLSGPVWNLDENAMKNVVTSLFLKPDIARVQISHDNVIYLDRSQPKYNAISLSTMRKSDGFYVARENILFDQEIIACVEVGMSSVRIKRAMLIFISLAIMLILILILAITTTSLYITNRIIFQPIRFLISSSRRIAEGDLEEPVSVSGQNEIAQLGLNFEHMRLEIKSLIKGLKDAGRLKDAFLANTTHELKTPINGILGITEALLNGSSGDLTLDLRRNLEIVISSGHRLLKHVSELLDYAKLQNGEMVLNIRPTALSPMVNHVLSILKPLIGKKNISLSNTIPKDFPNVLADPDKLYQILTNLIHNAIKFTDRGSIEISAQESETCISVSIRDTGIGIPAQEFSRIFTSFYQVEASNTRHYQGTGLGLHIVKSLIELHKGMIQVESKLGEGSCFTFTLNKTNELAIVPDFSVRLEALPLIINEPSISTSSPCASRFTPVVVSEDVSLLQQFNSENFCIFVVDDEPVNQQVMHLHLAEHHMVISCYDAFELFEKLKEQQPDIILLDVMLPNMSGYEVLAQLRRDYSVLDLPIIMVSAKDQVKDIVEGFSKGANDYLTKPFSRQELCIRAYTHIRLSRMNRTLAGFSRELAENNAKLEAYNNKLQETVQLRTRHLSLAKEEAEQYRMFVEEALRSKTTLLSHIGHDLRSPLHIIVGGSDLLARHLNGYADEKIFKCITMIQQSSNNLLKMVNNIFEFEELENNRMPVLKTRFPIGDLIDALTTEIQSLLQQKPIAYFIDGQLDSAFTLYTDYTKLFIVLQHLLKNAIKFTSAGHVRLTFFHENMLIYFKVQDTGMGITEPQLSHLFNTAYQLETQLFTNKQGLGLGLPFSKSLVTLLGGDIQVSSVLDQGTTFLFWIPKEG